MGFSSFRNLPTCKKVTIFIQKSYKMVTIGKNVSISQSSHSSRGLKYSHRHNRTLTGGRYATKTPPVMVEYREHKKPLRKPLRALEQKSIEKPPPGGRFLCSPGRWAAFRILTGWA